MKKFLVALTVFVFLLSISTPAFSALPGYIWVDCSICKTTGKKIRVPPYKKNCNYCHGSGKCHYCYGKGKKLINPVL